MYGTKRKRKNKKDKPTRPIRKPTVEKIQVILPAREGSTNPGVPPNRDPKSWPYPTGGS